jgi:glutamine amidotransferase
MITFLDRGIEVPVSEIYNGGTWNDDGHGWAVAAGTNHMVVGKSMRLDEALDAFMAARRAYPDAPALFHSRWATHGPKNTDNVHPFPVGDDAVMAHNGIMPSTFHPKSGDQRSDTRVFADLLTQSASGIWSRRERKRIARTIGLGNKLVILSVSPRFIAPRGFLINGHMGEFDTETGAWFSNGDYQATWDRHATGALGSTWGSGTWTTGGENGTHVVLGRAGRSALDDECPICYSTGTIRWETGECTACNSCVDCGEDLKVCQCYVPVHLRNLGERISPDDEEAAGMGGGDIIADIAARFEAPRTSDGAWIINPTHHDEEAK